MYNEYFRLYSMIPPGVYCIFSPTLPLASQQDFKLSTCHLDPTRLSFPVVDQWLLLFKECLQIHPCFSEMVVHKISWVDAHYHEGVVVGPLEFSDLCYTETQRVLDDISINTIGIDNDFCMVHESFRGISIFLEE